MQLIFVYVEMDNEDVGKPVSDYFGVARDAPTVMISYPVYSIFPFYHTPFYYFLCFEYRFHSDR